MRDGETAADVDLAATGEALKTGKDTILWYSELTGFGVRVHPSGTKACIVNYADRNEPAFRRLNGVHADFPQ